MSLRAIGNRLTTSRAVEREEGLKQNKTGQTLELQKAADLQPNQKKLSLGH